ncbi:MAG: hypothetical protein RL603_1382 [Pseudomonadota bacterium]|jgi:uncharacterized membrane protein YfcA
MDAAELLPLLAVLLAAGLAAGTIAGLLGVGGGIVLVPVLDAVLPHVGVPANWSLHVAVATSLASIVPTSIASSRAHHARGAVDWSLARAWAPGMILGALLGSQLAARAPAAILSGVFGAVALLAAAKMFLPLDELRLAERTPRGMVGNAIAAVIAIVSAVMGIGGGTLSVPAMTLTGSRVHDAVGTAALFGFLIALPGTLGYLFPATPAEFPTGTAGFVSLPALLVVTPCTLLTAPLGARIAHGLSKRRLSQLFGVFLGIVATRMLWRTALFH